MIFCRVKLPRVSDYIIPFIPDSAKPNIDKFSKITNWIKHQSKVLHNSFPMNGHTLGFCPQNQNWENFVSPKVLLGQSKG